MFLLLSPGMWVLNKGLKCKRSVAIPFTVHFVSLFRCHLPGWQVFSKIFKLYCFPLSFHFSLPFQIGSHHSECLRLLIFLVKPHIPQTFWMTCSQERDSRASATLTLQGDSFCQYQSFLGVSCCDSYQQCHIPCTCQEFCRSLKLKEERVLFFFALII